MKDRVRETRERTEKRLRARDLDKLPPGTHEDGGGLRFIVEQRRDADGRVMPGSRRWAQRFTLNGKRLARGLGPYPLVTLDAAREESLEIRRAARKGQDVAGRRRQANAAVTFHEAAEAYWATRKPSVTNAKHIAQWSASMENYVYPRIGDRPVSAVTRAEVVEVLKPIWTRIRPTARRVLSQMDASFKWAISHEHRERANPCTGVAQELGGQRPAVVHHPALPYPEVAAFIAELRACQSWLMSRLAFEWLVLTAARSGEVRGAMKCEINEEKALWVIPRERMKSRQEHVVPLAPRCLEIVRQAQEFNPQNELLFPSHRSGEPLSVMTFNFILRTLALADRATAHGFRSSFRDWATEVDKCREVVAEAALAHAVRGKVEAAYRRTKYLEERVGLMERWAAYCRA